MWWLLTKDSKQKQTLSSQVREPQVHDDFYTAIKIKLTPIGLLTSGLSMAQMSSETIDQYTTRIFKLAANLMYIEK